MPKSKLKKRPDGRYRKVVDGVTFYAQSERELFQKIMEYERKKEKGSTFSELADKWWNDAEEQLAAQSVKVYKPALARAVEYFGNDSVKDILPRDVASFYKGLAHKGFAQKTISNHRIVLNQVFTEAVISGEILYNPCASVPLPKGLKKTARAPAAEEDEKKILSSSSDWLFPLFALLSGLRKGEILALQWKDIDFEQNKISVTKSVEYVGDRPHIKAPKTAAGVRDVPLLTALRERILPRKSKPSDYIISDTGATPLTNRRFITLYTRYKKDVGISCTSHQLRHSYATVAVEQEVQPRDLQGVLGHSSATITLEKYAHYREKSIANVAQKLNQKYQRNHPEGSEKGQTPENTI